MDKSIGKVDQLWRYPVKSMAGEKIDSSKITNAGLLGDRYYAMKNIETNKILSAKNFRKYPDIFYFKSEYLNEPTKDSFEVAIIFPNKEKYLSTNNDTDKALSSFFNENIKLTKKIPDEISLKEYWPDDVKQRERDGKQVTNEFMPDGTFFDLATIHIITLSSIEKLKQLYPEGNFDLNRFRANIVIDLDSKEIGFIENDWVGKTIHIGDEVVLKITRATPRCVMTTLEHENIPKDKQVHKTIIKNNNNDLGVYAEVIKEGIIKKDDLIKIV